MVITRTLDIAKDVDTLRAAAKELVRLADDLNLGDTGVGLQELVRGLNAHLQAAGDARDGIEAAVDEYLNEGDDEFLDDEEDEGEPDINDDFPMYLEYDDWEADIPQPEF